jgi:rhamnogalacturonyl hydrolase YesR
MHHFPVENWSDNASHLVMMLGGSCGNLRVGQERIDMKLSLFRSHTLFAGRHLVLLALVGGIACSGSGGGSSPNESGGVMTTAGESAIGGGQAQGGTNSTGGVAVLGGASSAGGKTANATGGLVSTAGAPATGGNPSNTGGSANTGGGQVAGGMGNTGGSRATGGSISIVGGTSATGGSAANGGNMPTGGTKAATGGSVNVGGTSSTGGSKTNGGVSSTGGSKATGGTSSSTGGASNVGGTAGNAPNAADILATLKKVTAYEIQLGPEDPSWVNKWTEATFYIGVMEAYLATNDQTYLTDATNWGTKNKWTLLASPTRSADNQCAGQVYEDIYLANPTAAGAATYYANTKTNVDAMVASPAPGINKTSSDWWWCDALFMAPGVVSRLGKITGQASYYSFLDSMWASVQSGLFDKATGLFWRDSTFVNGTVYWARGNGWVMGGLVRVLEYLPTTDASYSSYTSLLTTMAAALKPWQQTDGTWHADITHPTRATMTNPEVSGTGLITYALAYGINQGLLDRATYQPVVFAAWNGMMNCVDAQGRVNYIQATGSAPAGATATETHDYGVGAFLLAGAQIYDMVK